MGLAKPQASPAMTFQMRTLLLSLPFLAAIALVVYAEGQFSGFMVWNTLPIAVGLGVFLLARRSSKAAMAACAAFAVSATLLVVAFHLAWFFDWGGTASGSSTSALAFVFVPLWAYVLAGAIGLLVWGVVRAAHKIRRAR